MSSDTQAMKRRARLVWRSRRGMRELDLLLQRFLERGLETLSGTEQDSFERLLDYPDQDILEWLSGRARAPDAGLEDIVRAIRAASG